MKYYVNELAVGWIPLDQLYVTNLCNKFLPPSQGRGTILIPDELAKHGVEAIRAILSQGNFRLILPMSVQVFYHLCRLDFIGADDESIRTFRNKACPSPSKTAQGIYASVSLTPFLEVCGRCFH